MIYLKVRGLVEENYLDIEKDMNARNSMSKKNRGEGSLSSSASSSLSSNSSSSSSSNNNNQKTRKKREELSISATKTIKKEEVEIVLNFD